MSSYTLYSGSPDIRQAQGGSAITSTSTNIDGGVIKAPGGVDGSKLTAEGLSQHDQSLYGARVFDGPDVAVGTANGPLANQEAGNYTMQLVSQNIATVQSNVLVGGGDPDKATIHSGKAVRTKKVATAIRAGYWNIFTGEFTTPPTTANDFSAMGSDDVLTASSNGRGLKGELTYALQGRVVSADYSPPTN